MAKDNPAYKKAQKAWIEYNDAYVKPITKGSATEIVKSLKDAKKNLDKLNPGYNIITEKGKKIIVLYDGKGDHNTLQVFSLEDIWNQFKE